MYRSWSHGLYGLHGPRCPLSKNAVKLNHSLTFPLWCGPHYCVCYCSIYSTMSIMYSWLTLWQTVMWPPLDGTTGPYFHIGSACSGILVAGIIWWEKSESQADKLIEYITGMSHGCWDMLSQITGSLTIFQQLVQATYRESIKALQKWPWVREIDQWIPLTKGQ